MDRAKLDPALDPPPVPHAALKSFAAGAISGAVAKTAVAPFDRYVQLVNHWSATDTELLKRSGQLHSKANSRGSI